jgi:acyl dehydratase
MQIEVGDTGPDFSVGPLSRTDIVRYAGAAVEFNRVHHDEPYARAAGFPSVFAHGMLSAGVLASFVTRWFGPNCLRHYRVRFREPVWPDDVLTAQGEVTRLFDLDGERQAELKIALLRQTGAPAVEGTAVVRIPVNPLSAKEHSG